MVRLSPSPPSSLLLYTHARHIRRANVNWWQEQNDTRKLADIAAKTFMQLVCEFTEKSFCFVLFVLQLSVMPQWASATTAGPFSMWGFRVTAEETRCRIATLIEKSD